MSEIGLQELSPRLKFELLLFLQKWQNPFSEKQDTKDVSYFPSFFVSNFWANFNKAEVFGVYLWGVMRSLFVVHSRIPSKSVELKTIGYEYGIKQKFIKCRRTQNICMIIYFHCNFLAGV